MSTLNYRVKFSSSEDEDEKPTRRRVQKTIFDSDSDEEVPNATNGKNGKATTTVKTTTSKQDNDDSDNDEYKPPRRSRKTIFDDSSDDDKQPVSKQDHLYCFSKPISIDAESDRKKNEPVTKPSFISSIRGTSGSSKPSVVETKTSTTTTSSSTVVKPRTATTESADRTSIKLKPEEAAPLPYDYKSIITKRINSNPSTTTNSSSADPFKYFDVMSTASSDTTRSARQSSVNADQSNTSYFNLAQIKNENIKLQSELVVQTASLKYNIQKLEEKPEFKSTIDRFISDKAYWFDLYKSKRDKINLLNESIKSYDGNAILAAILFMKRTLLPEIFMEIICNNLTALNQYSFYLRQLNDEKELIQLEKFQKNLGESTAIMHFKSILTESNQDLIEKERILNEFERNFNSAELPTIQTSPIYQAAKNHINLFKIQKEIMKNRSTFYRKDETKQSAMDRLLGNTVNYTLSFCLKYNRDLAENEIYSPENFRRVFDISNKEYSIWYTKAMAEVGHWTELERFLNQRTILNMVQKTAISHESIFYIIYYLKGPTEQIKKHLALVEDVERRRHLAMKLKYTDIVIETFKQKKDKIGLLNYRNQFKEESNEYILCNIAIKDNQIKWKN